MSDQLHLARSAAFGLLAALIAGILSWAVVAGASTAAPAPCPSPAAQVNGTYSSYRTFGTMPSGTVRRLDDGDLWPCRNGRVNVY